MKYRNPNDNWLHPYYNDDEREETAVKIIVICLVAMVAIVLTYLVFHIFIV